MHYDFDTVVDRTGTGAIKWDDKPGLLPLWIADMDFACAEPIVKAIHARADKQIFGYTETLAPTYTDAVTGWFSRRFGWDFDAKWIRYSAGVVQGLGALLHLLSAPGDKIIIQRPVYGPFTMEIETQKRVVCDCPLKLNGTRYEIDFDDLAAKMADPGVKGMIICSPHNPAGRVWSEDELRRILSLAKKNGIWLISDEIHCDILRAGVKHTPILKLAGDYADHVFACTAPSKSFNLAGMQLSNIIIPNEDIRRLWDGYVCSTLHVLDANPLSIAAMIAAYTEGDEWMDQANAYMDANLEFLKGYLAERLPKAFLCDCEGTYLAWVDFSAYEPDADKLSHLLLDDAKVYLTGGSFFGPESAHWQRINIACPRIFLREGIDRITAVLKRPR